MRNDPTRETRSSVSSPVSVIRVPERPGLNLGERVRSGRRTRGAAAVWSGSWNAGLDCYRWDARAWPYLENANLISIRTAEKTGMQDRKVYNKRDKLDELYCIARPVQNREPVRSSSGFLREATSKRFPTPLVAYSYNRVTLRYINIWQ